MSIAFSEAEPTLPYPPRYWWLKRIGIGTTALLILLLLIRFVWGWDANRRLETELAAMRARGEPTRGEDLESPSVPDSSNYVYYLRQAITAINPNADPPAATNMSYVNVLPLPKEWDPIAAKAVIGNQTPLQFLRKARQSPQINWGLKFNSASLYANSIPSLSSERHLANLLGDTALFEHLHENDSEAIESLQDLLALSNAVTKQQYLISYLVSVGIDALTFERICLIAPGLRLEGTPKSATPQQVRDLISVLLRDVDGPRFHAALASEKVFNLEMTASSYENSLILRPVYVLDLVRFLKIHDRFAAATQPLNRDSNPRSTSRKRISIDDITHLMSGDTSDTYDRMLQLRFKMEADRQMAAVSLAARLYQIDHAGQWPKNLKALVPAYLPAVPIDPLSPTAAPLKYILANGGLRPVVYSVGVEGKDDTPNESVLPPGPIYGSYLNQKDYWRDLSRIEGPPQILPSTQPDGTTQPE